MLALVVLWLLPDIGVDLLALQHPRFRSRTVAAYIKQPVAIGLLDGTFGSSTAHVDYLAKRGKISALRVHLFNGSCLRRKRCERHTEEYRHGNHYKAFDKAIRRGDLDDITRMRARKWCTLADRYTFPLFISPILEHNVSYESINRLSSIVSDVCPDHIPTHNPERIRRPGAYTGKLGLIQEIHGRQFQLREDCFYSADGTPSDIDSFVKLAHRSTCDVFLAWQGWMNGRHDTLYIAPSKRRAFGTLAIIKRTIRAITY